MALDEDIEMLRRVPIFSALGAEPLRLVAFSAEPRQYAAGDVIFRENDPADGAFVVMSGTVEFVQERLTDRIVRGRAGPGTLIGEMALIVETTRPVKAVALEPTRLQSIKRSQFRRILEEYPDLTRRLRDEIAARLTGLQPAIGALAQQFGQIDKPR